MIIILNIILHMIKILKNNPYSLIPLQLQSSLRKPNNPSNANIHLNARLYCRLIHWIGNSSKKINVKVPFNSNNNSSIQLQRRNKNSKVTPQQKLQVLQTYLQVIPPHRIQQLIKPQFNDISEFIHRKPTSNITNGNENEQQQQGGQLQPLTVQQLDKLHKKIKKYVHTIPIQSLTQVLQLISPFMQSHLNKDNTLVNTEVSSSLQGQQQKQQYMMCRKMYTKILATATRKLQYLSLQQIINFMYKLVKLNHKQFQFMKEVQNLLIQQKIPINYHLIRKILWSYTHLDVGSSILYSHVARTIKIGRHELGPLEIAQSAYMLSKVSDNGGGGYGIFQIAEEQIKGWLPRLDFRDLCKVSVYMLAQNLGSNQFQTQLQAQIYKKFPDKSKLRVNDLVKLLKSTSAYYFKYKDKALLNILKSSTQKIAPETNLQQFQDIIWSWGRAGKGDKQLWNILQHQINKKYINLLKPRQLAFFYYSLCSTQYSSPQVLQNIEKKFISLYSSPSTSTSGSLPINPHYPIKFLLGMQKRRCYGQAFQQLSHKICQNLPSLSRKQLITFAKIINQSDLCFENKNKFIEMEAMLRKTCRTCVTDKVYLFQIKQIIQILYMFVKLDVRDVDMATGKKEWLTGDFYQLLFKQLEIAIQQIPKSVFIKALFCFTIKDRYKQSIQMIRILQSLLKYGSIPYFFSPHELPLAAYCAYHLVVNSKGQIKFEYQLMEQLGEALDKINQVTLNQFVRKGHLQAKRLRNLYIQANRFGQTETNEETVKRNKRKRR